MTKYYLSNGSHVTLDEIKAAFNEGKAVITCFHSKQSTVFVDTGN